MGNETRNGIEGSPINGEFHWLLRFGKGSRKWNMEKGASNVENVSMQILGVSTSDDKYCGDSVMGTL